MIDRCVRWKMRIVEEDPRERGPRMLLNFGHTIGHAIEAACGYGTYLHGEAVAIGMVGAAQISRRLGSRGDAGGAPGGGAAGQRPPHRYGRCLASPAALLDAAGRDKKAEGPACAGCCSAVWVRPPSATTSRSTWCGRWWIACGVGRIGSMTTRPHWSRRRSGRYATLSCTATPAGGSGQTTCPDYGSSSPGVASAPRWRPSRRSRSRSSWPRRPTPRSPPPLHAGAEGVLRLRPGAGHGGGRPDEGRAPPPRAGAPPAQRQRRLGRPRRTAAASTPRAGDPESGAGAGAGTGGVNDDVVYVSRERLGAMQVELERLERRAPPHQPDAARGDQGRRPLRERRLRRRQDAPGPAGGQDPGAGVQGASRRDHRRRCGGSSGVGVGSRVRLVEVASGDELDYQVVGPEETNPRGGKISHRSPVGRAILGKGAGDEVEVATPGGAVRYRIVSVD